MRGLFHLIFQVTFYGKFPRKVSVCCVERAVNDESLLGIVCCSNFQSRATSS
jgi:hypothetical protein